jgi:hypothetical protein
MHQMSPQRLARLGGRLYLVVIAAAVFAELSVRSNLIVPGDAAATLRHIVASESLFRVAIAGDLVMLACEIALTLVLYHLLKSVHREVAQLTAVFRLVGIAVLAVNLLMLMSVLMLVTGQAPMAAFGLLQQEEAAMTLLRLHASGYQISLVFFGFHCVLLGALIYASRYFPKVLGVLVAFGGLGYLIGSLAVVVSPALSSALSAGIVLPGFLGELALCLWLLFGGVNVWQWHARVTAVAIR